MPPEAVARPPDGPGIRRLEGTLGPAECRQLVWLGSRRSTWPVRPDRRLPQERKVCSKEIPPSAP
ncbi:hypothetical protein KL86PLE_90097 [uncultured Pleomorphomonas sp.]|uniref:Uncharacterized protein n=1 Tax=uncultured Pleomorphomonas sp. TaxID=442121 RepID=A0A212LMS1_9HYPH|nr:hypothetical protein KL86PLE_90097 [uncultured Pleomorphomonas sp.]